MPLTQADVEFLTDKAKQDRFFTRTMEHIHRVQNNMLVLVTYYFADLERIGFGLGDRRLLMHDVMIHDQSKFSHMQYEPYIELTEFFHQKKTLGNDSYQYPKGVHEAVTIAINDHYLQENHHPERLALDQNSREYDKFDMLETMCDLQAMAQEFNEGSCRNFYQNVWTKKHRSKFNDLEWKKLNNVAMLAIDCFESEAIRNKK